MATEADTAPPPPTFEQRVDAAVRVLRRRGTPHRLRVGLVESGLEADTAERVVAAARRRMNADSRQLGAKIAEGTVWVLCGTLLVALPLGLELPTALVMVAGLITLGLSVLVWLTGVGEAD